MIILVGFYNAEKYIERCLYSILGQSFKDFKCYITHDMSTDNSIQIVKKIINGDNRFVLIDEYEKKLYQAGNFDKVLRYNTEIEDDDFVIEVDGDDWLPDSNVFERIDKIYRNPNVWIANGSFKYSNGQNGFASPQKNFDNLRSQRFTASHIRTWRVFLWRNILESDLKDENGDYWQWSGDLCFMFPMLEMAGDEHYRFMYETNYIYNETNPINEHKVDMFMVNKHATAIRNKKPYSRLIRQ